MSGGQPPKDIKDALSAMLLDENKPKQSYAFWGTQPVAQFNEAGNAIEAADGPIDQPKTVADVRPDSLPLPSGFEWSTCDVNDPVQLKEVYELLSLHYVEDDENMFRFDYSPQFLHWALQPPGYKQEWHCGVRVSGTGKLVAFISAIPALVRIRDDELQVVEINFLCIHKKLRQKRLAPVLIKEITRRVNLQNIWQAVYTAGVVLPKPVAEGQYWHRTLNPKKLIAVGFSHLSARMTIARMIKLYKLPEKPLTPGLRPMEARDVPAVTKILKKYLQQYKLAPCLDEEEVQHWLVPRADVVYAYVVENPETHEVTDLVSFYTLPSTVIGNAQYSSLKAAYFFYTVPVTASARQLLNDALILAHSTGHDVFNALDIFENEGLMKELKFGIGDGRHFCGGVLINPRSVLTAAYCVSPTALNINPEVWCGDIQDIHNSSRGAGTVDALRAVKTTLHECYNARKYFNDIAVLQLNASVVHGKPIKNIIQEVKFEKLQPGDQLIGLGWGQTRGEEEQTAIANNSTTSAASYPKMLQEAVLPFISAQECNTPESYNNTVERELMFCAGYFDGRADTCAGDSGGPLVQGSGSRGSGGHGDSLRNETNSTTTSTATSGDTLVGIVSWGSGCASKGFPGVYSRVDVHHDWIVLHSHCACSTASLTTMSSGSSGNSNVDCILVEESGEVTKEVEHKADISAASGKGEVPALCYVIDFEKCPLATASTVYPGKGWLPCRKNNQTGEIETIHNATSCSFSDTLG